MPPVPGTTTMLPWPATGVVAQPRSAICDHITWYNVVHEHHFLLGGAPGQDFHCSLMSLRVSGPAHRIAEITRDVLCPKCQKKLKDPNIQCSEIVTKTGKVLGCTSDGRFYNKNRGPPGGANNVETEVEQHNDDHVR